jgi:hypothetical protein
MMDDKTRTLKASNVCKECSPARVKWIVEYLKQRGWDVGYNETGIMTGFDAEANPGLYLDFCVAVSKSYQQQPDQQEEHEMSYIDKVTIREISKAAVEAQVIDRERQIEKDEAWLYAMAKQTELMERIAVALEKIAGQTGIVYVKNASAE